MKITPINLLFTPQTQNAAQIQIFRDGLTASRVKVLYELNTNTNAFTDDEKVKLAAIETGATADQLASEVMYDGTSGLVGLANDVATALDYLYDQRLANAAQVDSNTRAIGSLFSTAGYHFNRLEGHSAAIEVLKNRADQLVWTQGTQGLDINVLEQRVTGVENVNTAQQSNILSNASAIQSNDQDIEVLKNRADQLVWTQGTQGLDINVLEQRVTGVENVNTAQQSNILSNASAIQSNDQDIEVLKNRADQLVWTQGTQGLDINVLEQRVTGVENVNTAQQSNILSNASAIQSNVTGISYLQGTAGVHKSLIDQNTAGITALGTRVTSTENVNTAQANDIQTNSASITALDDRVDILEALQGTQGQGITGLNQRLDEIEGLNTQQSQLIQDTLNDISYLYGTAGNHFNRLEGHSADISTLQNDVSQAQTGIIGLENEVLYLQGTSGVLQDQLATVDSTLDSHIQDLNNPHAVTKAQVGLSNVLNIDTSRADLINAGTNNLFFTQAERLKLATLDPDAIGLSAADIKSLYESNNDTNAFTDAEKLRVSNTFTAAADGLQSVGQTISLDDRFVRFDAVFNPTRAFAGLAFKQLVHSFYYSLADMKQLTKIVVFAYKDSAIGTTNISVYDSGDPNVNPPLAQNTLTNTNSANATIINILNQPKVNGEVYIVVETDVAINVRQIIIL